MAVLTSQLAASSGEFAALAFRSLPRVRNFGEPTAGLPTANRQIELSDGAMILLTVSLGVDRSGQVHDGPFPPDYHVTIAWTQLGTVDDPVLQIAIQWLHAEPGCV